MGNKNQPNENQPNKNQPNENQLNKDDNKKPIVIRFNPWNYSSVDQLITMFFTELKTGIGHVDRKKDLFSLLDKIGNLIKPSRPVTGGLLKLFFKSDETLPNVKKKINELLSQLDQKVIIFIDDIDRLERDFMRMLLRMIRLNADFSNVTYVPGIRPFCG